MNCTVEGCQRPIIARGMCRRCYKRWARHGDPTVVLSNAGGGRCSRVGCASGAVDRGLCQAHLGVLVGPPPGWVYDPHAEPDPSRAACTPADADSMLYHGGTGNEDGRLLCRRCPEVHACLSWAIRVDEPVGMWGSCTPSERQAERRRLGLLPVLRGVA